MAQEIYIIDDSDELKNNVSNLLKKEKDFPFYYIAIKKEKSSFFFF